MKDYSRTLFVCTGNVFRSVFAEKLFTRQTALMNLHYRTRSRGTKLCFDAPNPLLVDIVSRRFSVNIKDYRPQELTKADIEWASIIICFTNRHVQFVLEFDPSVEYKTYTFRDITFFDQTFFEDIDYCDIFETNEKLLNSLDTIALAVRACLDPATFSIVMPIYNEERTIKNILEKLLSQSTSERVKEIVVVSSGSTDSTEMIVESMKSPKLIVVKEKTRNGKVSALKMSVPFITGENVLLLDGDVDIKNDFIRKCFLCIYGGRLPCTGKVVPAVTDGGFLYKLSLIGCEAWNKLRAKNDRTKTFLYPSGYTLLLTKDEFSGALECMDDGAINDDGLFASILFRRGIVFRYCDWLEVYVVFPQTVRDFFRQKVRTRMGRRQMDVGLFKGVEKKWRSELVCLTNKRNLLSICALLLMDFMARCIADVKIRISPSPHLWSPVESTKHTSLK